MEIGYNDINVNSIYHKLILKITVRVTSHSLFTKLGYYL